MQEEFSQYIKAGKIAAKALYFAENKVHEEMPVLEICEAIENYIKNEGGNLAFPCNVSINQVAAHDTAELDEEFVIPKKSLVKIDVGVHIDGYIADAARTICFNDSFSKLVEATRASLKNAIEALKAGITANRIGKIIDNTAKSYGFNTIKNLSGHMIKRNLLHAGKSIPNFDDGYEVEIKPFEVYAIEPFLTNGKGHVYDSDKIKIYSFKRPLRHKDKQIDKILSEIWKERFYLPFCARWYAKKIEYEKLKEILIELYKRKEIVGYNVLIEESGGMVAQEEHTVIIGEKEVIVTTSLE